MTASMKEYLVGHIATVHGATKRLLDDVTEEESLVVLGNTHNHIKWLAGHLATTSVFTGKLLGGNLSIAEDWSNIFRRGADVQTDPRVFPPINDIRKKLYDLFFEVEQLAASADETFLHTKREILPNWHDTTIGAVLFFCAHDFYHAGQIAMIRRHLGRERMFG